MRFSAFVIWHGRALMWGVPLLGLGMVFSGFAYDVVTVKGVLNQVALGLLLIAFGWIPGCAVVAAGKHFDERRVMTDLQQSGYVWSELSPLPYEIEQYHISLFREPHRPALAYQFHVWRFRTDEADFWRLALHMPVENDAGRPTGYLAEYEKKFVGSLADAKRHMEGCYEAVIAIQ